ncbi:MAG: fused MFS/spermidine synthase [Deltaproteobacteria bacterium]|nr:fused MFS/spermidine synthase [Deltaproteobacteria bacterium]
MRWTFAMLLVGLGCLATSGQVFALREFLVVFAGNELSLGTFFACWFTGILAGAFAGGRLIERGRIARACPTWLLFCCLAMLGLLAWSLLGLRAFRGLLGVQPGVLPGLGALLLTGATLIAPLGLAVGAAFPLACRAAREQAHPATIGRVYVLESAGAVLGGLLATVLLAGRLGGLSGALLCSLPLLAAGGLWGVEARRARAPAIASFGLLAAAVAALAAGWLAELDASSTGRRFGDLGTGGRRLAWTESAYQFLDLAEQGGQYTLYANGKVLASFPDPYLSRPRAHLVLCQHPGPRRVLLLGSASVGFLQPALRHPGIERLDWVEIDPAILALIRPQLPDLDHLLADARIRSRHTDARRLLGSSSARWDLIFSDAPDPDTAGANRFYTLEFFEQVRAHLQPDGVFAARLSSSAEFLGSQTEDRLHTVQATLAQVFARVLVLPGQETFLFASDADVLLERPAELGRRYGEHGAADPHFSVYQFESLVQPERVAALRDQLAGRGRAPTNTDARPLCYLQSVLRWSRLQGDRVGAALGWLAGLPVWVWFALLGALAVLALGALRRGGERALQRAGLLSVIALGGLGMTLELALSFAYQALAGSLYQELGLIVAAFMAGLVGGGWCIDRRMRAKPATAAQLGVALGALSLFTAALPAADALARMNGLPMWAGQLVLLACVLAAGAGTGVVFPLASALAVSSGRSLGRAAGDLDAADQLGAAAGSFLTGLVLLPALGQVSTCLLWAAVMAVAAALVLWTARSGGARSFA